MESSQNPSLYAKKLGHKFVGLYLNALVDGDLNTALEFYVPEAVLTRSHPQTGDRTLNGTEEIREELKKTHEKLLAYRVVVKSIDAQPSLNNTILLNVVVELEKDKSREVFVQTFVLLGQVGINRSSYHVSNDIINYIDVGAPIKSEKATEPIPKKEEVKKTRPVEEPKPVIKEEVKPVQEKPVVLVEKVVEKRQVATTWASVVTAKPGEVDTTRVITRPEEDVGDLSLDDVQGHNKDEKKPHTRGKRNEGIDRRGQGRQRGRRGTPRNAAKRTNTRSNGSNLE